MDKFTPEISHNIFIRLSLKQRLVCTLICRKWWHVLDKSSLFYSVRNININDLINYFEQRPDHAAQVQDLRIAICVNRRFCDNILLKIFSNVRVAREMIAGSMKRFSEMATHIQFYKYMTKKYINRIYDEYDVEALRGTNSTQIYYDGVIQFFEAIGPRQRKLAIYGLPNGK